MVSYIRKKLVIFVFHSWTWSAESGALYYLVLFRAYDMLPLDSNGVRGDDSFGDLCRAGASRESRASQGCYWARRALARESRAGRSDSLKAPRIVTVSGRRVMPFISESMAFIVLPADGAHDPFSTIAASRLQ